MEESVVRVYKGNLRSGFLILGENHNCILEGENYSFKKIHFGIPVKVDDRSFRTWDGVMVSPLWDIPVELEFASVEIGKTEDELNFLGHKKLESLAVRMSFITSIPVEVLPGGGLKPLNGGIQEIDGVIHGRSVYTATESGQLQPSKTLNHKGVEAFKEFFFADKLAKVGPERIERSLRWLLHSYKAPTVVDEFISLMIAFEAISELLDSSGESESYWECSQCEGEFRNCPTCNASTGFARPGNKKMGAFVIKHLNWSKKEWNALWNLRSKISHGSRDISFKEEQEVIKSIEKTEQAVTSALSHVIGFPKNIPANLRSRNQFYGAAQVVVEWTSQKEDVQSD
jgi:hypothetical protein